MLLVPRLPRTVAQISSTPILHEYSYSDLDSAMEEGARGGYAFIVGKRQEVVDDALLRQS